jgi:peptidylprolyl isomerase
VRVLLLAAALAAFGAAGCGDDDDERASDPTTETRQVTAQQKPEVPKPEGPPPKELQSEDLREGQGEAAKAGDTVSVHYVGVLHENGKQFDASWDRGQPFEFQLGAGMVIPGWDQGVEGMKPGGRRRLTIPPDLAYGERGAPPDIGPNEPLVFVIDLLRVR